LADIKKADLKTFRILDTENMLQWSGILIPVSRGGICCV
jgi:hypothetical protein